MIRNLGEHKMLSQSTALTIMDLLRQQKYQLIGSRKTAAVKKCYWLHMALTSNRFCYKNWYGIESHRCIQMTPTLACPNSCLHCWRIERGDPNTSPWKEEDFITHDDEKAIFEQAIRAQFRILSGYKSNPKVIKERYVEALHPRHFAISLAGEPTLYNRLGEFIELCRSKGFTTFLVTNGMYPEKLASLIDKGRPSQLYISVNASSDEKFMALSRCSLIDGWQRLMRSLRLLREFKCPTVIRITVIRGVNDHENDIESFAKLISLAEPWYVEVKGFMYLGYSRFRLELSNMPKHRDVLSFAEKLSKVCGYNLVAESLASRVALLSRISEPVKVHP
ncbi:4-demethylwyosine synthase TYW1 [Candidatus Nezhaarchaeota archaeon WYZ-LMO8]|nr:MAG: 4-demethylwyosine synthase TYW1 [Candidatus Nezhaarchaeota archaeon WYZ-LMO8]TDA37163.1 MAG: 4-demethylwyosine synthase TYW1 [Candidatus Nezhaarchaeota archaeon WYZ-LMO7]